MVGFDGFEEESTGPSTNRKLGIRCCGRKQKNGGHPADARQKWKWCSVRKCPLANDDEMNRLAPTSHRPFLAI
jgi:hypothetical protein